MVGRIGAETDTQPSLRASTRFAAVGGSPAHVYACFGKCSTCGLGFAVRARSHGLSMSELIHPFIILQEAIGPPGPGQVLGINPPSPTLPGLTFKRQPLA